MTVLHGAAMYALAERLYPLPRSITGDGVRATLAMLGEHVPVNVHEVPSGTTVLDWTVPPEWNVREAWLSAPDGTRVADFAESSLHLLGYSEPFQGDLGLAELREHLYSLPEYPDVIPYRTSYYRRTWGFCLPHRVVSGLPEGDYHVHIDSELNEAGSLTYGEIVVPGGGSGDVLVSTHICHPALANDNLSGLVVTAALAQQVAAIPRRRFTYRFIFVPGTIGAVTWLARHREDVDSVQAGLVLTGLGDRAGFRYKRSRLGDRWVDRVVPRVLRARGEVYETVPFGPYGYDERQYCSPGFDLPVGRLGRSAHGEYPEYHTSADGLGFISAENLQGALDVLVDVVRALESERRFRNLVPFGEPQLGKRGLYRSLGASMNRGAREMAFLWMLSYGDGCHSVDDIAEASGLSLEELTDAAATLVAAGLLREE